MLVVSMKGAVHATHAHQSRPESGCPLDLEADGLMLAQNLAPGRAEAVEGPPTRIPAVERAVKNGSVHGSLRRIASFSGESFMRSFLLG